jgi:glycosyltransferase involved in cell wall biosynthesis
MRVLAFLLNDYDSSRFLRGSERRFLEISKRLKQFGVQIFGLEYESLRSNQWGPQGYVPITIKPRLTNHGALNSLRIITLGLLACVRCKCDIIYATCHLSWKEGVWAGVIAPYVVSRLCRKPFVIVFHHLQPSDFKERNPIKLGAYQRAVRIAVSEATASDVRKAFRVLDVKVAGNGIDTQLFRADYQTKKLYDATFLGRITEDKGVFVLLSAWKIVVEKMQSAVLLLIGSIDDKIREKVESKIRDLRCTSKVITVGFVSDIEMVRLLKSSKIFVLPSLREGFGLVVAEAMASGLPCIISDLPALAEIFSSAAILVPPSDPESLGNAILSLLADSDKRNELVEKGQRLVSRFSWQKVAAKEFEILESLVAH